MSTVLKCSEILLRASVLEKERNVEPPVPAAPHTKIVSNYILITYDFLFRHYFLPHFFLHDLVLLSFILFVNCTFPSTLNDGDS